MKVEVVNLTLYEDGTMNIDIWKFGLDLPAKETNRLRRILSPAELNRSDRYVREIDQLRSIVGRASLRLILSRYLEVEPEDICFSFGKFGKPYLAGTDLKFNLSHSDKKALLAIGEGSEVGIDIEVVREISDLEKIVAEIFSIEQALNYRARPQSEQLKWFFEGFTRKESILKASGLGLSRSLNSVGKNLHQFQEATVVEFEGQNYHLVDVSSTDYVGCLAVQNEIDQIKEFVFSMPD